MHGGGLCLLFYKAYSGTTSRRLKQNWQKSETLGDNLKLATVSSYTLIVFYTQQKILQWILFSRNSRLLSLKTNGTSTRVGENTISQTNLSHALAETKKRLNRSNKFVKTLLDLLPTELVLKYVQILIKST